MPSIVFLSLQIDEEGSKMLENAGQAVNESRVLDSALDSASLAAPVRRALLLK
jgi:hypothetical protein